MSEDILGEKIPGIILIEPRVFEDDRGFFLETYHLKRYQSQGIKPAFVQDNHSHSCYRTLRGLHYQLKRPQAKLIYVVSGEILDVAVDIRVGSPHFAKWYGVKLSGVNKCQIYLPPGFAHGFSVLSESADVIYKCTDFYDPEDEYGIFWADPKIAVNWQNENPLLSPKDLQNPTLDKIPKEHLPAY